MATTIFRKLSTNEAAKLAGSALDLHDLKRLSIALAEAAAEEVIRSRTFAERVRALYESVPATVDSRGNSSPSALTLDLVPIKPLDGRWVDPSTPLDPYFVLDTFGPHQLERALAIFPLTKLKEASAAVEARNPGTKPTNRGQKAAIIAYIVEELTTPQG